MFRSSGLNDRALRLVQGEIAGVAPKRIPNLLDEPKALSDGQPGDVDGWIYHMRNLCSAAEEDNGPNRGAWVEGPPAVDPAPG